MKQLFCASATLRPVPSAAMDRVAGQPGNRNGGFGFVAAADELVIIRTANKRT